MTTIIKDVKPFPTYREIRSKDIEWINNRSEEYWDYRKKWIEYPKNLQRTQNVLESVFKTRYLIS